MYSHSQPSKSHMRGREVWSGCRARTCVTWYVERGRPSWRAVRCGDPRSASDGRQWTHGFIGVCSACTSGSHAPAGSVISSACIPCAANQYRSRAGCELCPGDRTPSQDKSRCVRSIQPLLPTGFLTVLGFLIPFIARAILSCVPFARWRMTQALVMLMAYHSSLAAVA